MCIRVVYFFFIIIDVEDRELKEDLKFKVLKQISVLNVS